jgi:hypothetical protein
MGCAPPAGKGFFPLDEVLGLLPGELTPHGHECLVRLGSWMPFKQAAELLNDFFGIRVSPGVSQRYTEEAGAAYEQLQQEEVERLEQTALAAETGADKLQMSVDGAMVPLVHGVWVEAKTLVIGEVQPAVIENGISGVHTRNLSYFSRKVYAETFQRLALGEVHRRGVETAQEVAAIMDGAEWEQGFVDYHCPEATRILDFPHAAEHVNLVSEFLHGEHTPESQIWLQERLHRLKHKGPDELLLELQKLQQQFPEASVIASNLAYLEKRKAQLQYPQFQAEGWPIGSGIVESGNKLVVEVRLKGSGMHWAEEHVNPMLALRNVICSDRWKEEWPKIEDKLRQKVRLRKRKLRESRRAETVAPPSPLVPALPFVDERILQSISTRLEQESQPKLPKKNPWRNFKYGKVLYQRPTPPKN